MSEWQIGSLKILEFKCFPLFLFYAGGCLAYVCVCARSAHGDRKGVTDPQGLVLQMAVGCPVDAGNGSEALGKNSVFICYESAAHTPSLTSPPLRDRVCPVHSPPPPPLRGSEGSQPPSSRI